MSRAEMDQRGWDAVDVVFPETGPKRFTVGGVFKNNDVLSGYVMSIEAHDANVLPYVPTGEEDADLEPDDEDDAAAMPKSVVIDDAFIWEGDRPPNIPWADTVIYEMNVRGFTMS